jgi:hypothetical protein
VIGFVPPVAPLLIDTFDLVYIAIGLAAVLVVLAGWTIYGVVFQVFKDISILGFKPFAGIANALEGAMRSLAGPLIKVVAPFAHLLWALAMTIWRPLYIIGDTLRYLLGQIVGVNQGSQQGLASLRAQERADIAAVNAHEQASVTALENRMAALDASLHQVISTDIAAVNAHEQASVTALENRMAALNASLTGQLNADINTVNNRINQVNTGLTNRLNADIGTVNATIANDVRALEGQVSNGVSTAESFASGLVSGLGVGTIASTVTSLAARLSKVETETATCLDPLCDTVTPQAQRIGNHAKFSANLSDLAIAAALVAMAAELMTNPGPVIDDIHTVVTDVGSPLVSVARDLIGA